MDVVIDLLAAVLMIGGLYGAWLLYDTRDESNVPSAHLPPDDDGI